MRTAAHASDHVSLSSRLLPLVVLRAVSAALAVGVVVAWPSTLSVPAAHVLAVVATYCLAAAAAEVGRRRLRRRAAVLSLVGGALLVDGLFLVAVTHATSGDSSPLRHLVLVHLVTVTLLASYRTGVKLALWHSLLLVCVERADAAVLLPRGAAEAPSAWDPGRAGVFVVTLWLVTLATAVASATNERELRRRRYDLEALAYLAAGLEGATAPAQVGELLASSVCEEFAFPRAVVLEVAAGDGDRPRLRLLAHRGAAQTGVPAWEPPARSVLSAALCSRRTLLVDGPAASDELLHVLLPDAVRLVVVVLVAEDRPVGLLVAEHGTRNGTRVQARVVAAVERFASQTALALAGARLLEHVRDLATRDGLTGVANRRTLDEVLAREAARAARSGRPLSVALVDVDHFKALNDTHGHQVGDEVLRTVAGTLAGSVRVGDTVGRYGGEEFVVVLPDTPAGEAREAAERLRLAVRASASAVPVAASFGVATLGPADAAADPPGLVAGLVAAADRALYAAKAGGRDRVATAPPAAPAPRTPGDAAAGPVAAHATTSRRSGSAAGGAGSGAGSGAGAGETVP